jgi:hypothetical protein
MGGDLDQEISSPEIQNAPESPGHQSSQDEDKVPGKDMNSGVNNGGGQAACAVSPFLHEVTLQKSAPEDFLSRAGDEEEKEKDRNPAGPRPQRINSPHLGFRASKKVRGQSVSEVENQIKDRSRKKTQEERGEMEGDLRFLPE